eukprot:TRINITY_DN593_c1_g5_i1.p1 TRINITY_DN593_c1_g5~~TRINITY_DN593_c1_g5_i1.p1  ORF type:complete len:129 (-),score=39.51 TRINITY_DN593_c1_g5_i1:147-533(-)
MHSVAKKKLNTKFPMARIKKIMQSDEDIGKIALAGPVLMSRCVELFIKDFVEKSVEIAREQKYSVITPAHLKLCVEKHNLFDFLQTIIDEHAESSTKSVKNSSKKKGRAKKNETEDDSDVEENEQQEE